MTPDRTRRARELFDLAIERDAATRATFLAEACGEDEQLRHEVESLLAFDSGTAHYIDRPALSLAARELAGDHARLENGRKIQRYTVLSRLGAGGMGEVYLAEDSTLGRKVALKLLPESFTADAEHLARFEREARAASALNHPSIITVHEIGSADGVHFIATEFVEGETLRQRLARGPLTAAEALDIGVHIAEALAAAHEAGVIHRDIKPENIMVRRDGYVKVLDFGIAKLVGRGERDEEGTGATGHPLTTEPGRMMGTVAYMSPEQLHALDVDTRTDIWSLGIVLFELVTGRRPFVAQTTAGIITAILERDLPAIVSDTGEVPDVLARIIRRALQRDRELRYPTARELLEDMRAASADLEFAERIRPSPADAPKPISVRRPAALAAIAVVLAAVAAVGVFLARTPGTQPVGIESPIRSIAVLPFLPLAVDERNESLELGLADTLITRLSGVRSLDVRPLSAVRPYAEVNRDPLAAGRALKVEAVLEGSVQQAGDRLRVNLRLLSVRDGSALWSAAVDEQAADIFAVQDTISERVAAALRLDLSGDEHQRLSRRDTHSPEAYQLYLKGRYFLDRRGDEWRQKSIEHFSKAIEVDPAYAPAYAGLADAYYEMVYWGDHSPRDYMPRAKAAAERALAIDDALADAHASLAIVLEDYEWKFGEAEREYRRAIELNPKYALARQRLGQLLAEQGRFDESRVEQTAALEIDPLSLNANMSLAALAYLSRDYDGAVEQLRRTLDLDPAYGEATGLLGWVYVLKGAHDDAVRTWLGDSDTEAARELRRAYAAKGIRGYFQRDLERAKGEARRGRRLPIFTAIELTYLGRRDEAFDFLEAAYQERHSWLGELRVEPAWDGLRPDPRFADLVRRVGLEP